MEKTSNPKHKSPNLPFRNLLVKGGLRWRCHVDINVKEKEKKDEYVKKINK
jgi:hypothetical protein